MNRHIKFGDFVEIKKVFSQEEVNSYNTICGDSNPIHNDYNYASRTFFKKPIVPGLLVTSLFGGLLGSKIPGEGTIFLGQEVKFIKPIYIGEEVSAKIKIINVREDKPIFTFSTTCFNENGEIAIEGEATVYYKGKYFV
jgi:acyl dehydratase